MSLLCYCKPKSATEAESGEKAIRTTSSSVVHGDEKSGFDKTGLIFIAKASPTNQNLVCWFSKSKTVNYAAKLNGPAVYIPFVKYQQAVDAYSISLSYAMANRLRLYKERIITATDLYLLHILNSATGGKEVSYLEAQSVEVRYALTV